MLGPLNQLIYCSRQKIQSEQLDTELDSIIRASIDRNERVGVTGLLLAHQGWFLQILEGPPVAVQTVYGRIINDKRHTASHLITAAPIPSRGFGDWHMCAKRLSAEDDAILQVLELRGVFEPAKLNAAQALRLLLAVRGIQDRGPPRPRRGAENAVTAPFVER